MEHLICIVLRQMLLKKECGLFYAMDTSVSVYGAKIGMNKATVHNALSKNGWRKSSDSVNNVMHTNTLGYDKGSYHVVVIIKYNKVTSMSYYNTECSW